MLSKKITPFHDAAKALGHCEICQDEIESESLPPWVYEFFFNSFIFYINQCWELASEAFQNSNVKSPGGEHLIQRVGSMRNKTDPLIMYVREARNQLSHRESILWISDEQPEKPEGLGYIINLSDSYYKANWKRYSCVVLPSFVLNFSGSQIAAKPVFTKSGEMIPVPQTHEGKAINNSPTQIMKSAYEFYGQSFSRLFQYARE